MKSKRNIRLMYAIALLQGMVFYGPIATLYRQAAGVSVFQITLIESISLALALEVPWGILADRIGYRRSMIVCCGLYFLSKIVFWQASGFGGFLAERLMLSVVCAGLSGLDVSILYLSCPEEESHRVFGIYNNLGMAGLLTASAVYAVFVGENYRLAGLLTVFSYGAAAVLALFLREVHPSQARTASHQLADFAALLKQLARSPRLLLLVLAAAILLLRVCHSLFTPLQTTLQNRQVTTGDRATALSLNALLMDTVAVFTNLVFGRAADVFLPLAMGFGFALCFAGLVLYLASSRPKTGSLQ